MNPWLQECWVNGRRWRQLEGQRLHAVLGKLRGRSADLAVEARRGGVEGYRYGYRLVLAWNPTTQQHVLLATNLDKIAFSGEAVQSLYRLRWQVELLFKEWKSYANLHAFGTRKAGIAEGLIWANLAAALLKRHLAHATQLAFASAEISTRTTAMSLGWHLQPVLRALLLGRDARRPLRELLRFLSRNAQRAHPRRDRARGRLRDGIEPLRLDAALRLRAIKN
jgi:IS4 transposase